MKTVYFLTYLMIIVYTLGETLRRGLSYFSVNATTMMEDYLCGALMIVAAFLWAKGSALAHRYMIAAWGYATGGMFVPFFSHLEAYLRGATFRADHSHEDLNSVILKGVIWGISLICFIVVLRHKESTQNTVARDSV